MNDRRRVLDVSHLPTVSFGHQSVVWWGTVGFAVIEGFTLALGVTAYFYLNLNERSWPPAPTPDPDLLLPTINVLLLLAIIIPMRFADRAARRFEKSKVIKGLAVATGLSTVAVILRGFDLLALNVRWDAHAYGSVTWMLLVLHSTLLVVDLWETAIIGLIFVVGREEKKHYSDVSDAAFYQYYLSLAWVPLYVIVYWWPRIG